MSNFKIGNFFCVDCNCGANLKGRDFQIETNLKDKEKCPNNKKLTLKLLGHMSTSFIIDKSKHAKGRTVDEKNKRRTDHFEKEVLPTLGGSDRQHFETKRKLRKQGKIK